MPLCMLLCGPKIRNKDLVFLYSCILISLKFECSIGSDCANAQVCQINFVSFHRIF